MTSSYSHLLTSVVHFYNIECERYKLNSMNDVVNENTTHFSSFYVCLSQFLKFHLLTINLEFKST